MDDLVQGAAERHLRVTAESPLDHQQRLQWHPFVQGRLDPRLLVRTKRVHAAVLGLG
jgi:hypothetical protein